MARTDNGEFELILGNRQLLAVFFIVVVLLGVFFVMGYIVGRNTMPQMAGQPDPAQIARTNPIVVEPAGGGPPPVPTEPKRTEPGPSKPPPPESKEPPKPAPTAIKTEPVKPPEPKPVVPARPAPSGGEPIGGATYLQVAATKKPEADLLVEVLGKKGFRAQTSPVPGQPLLRVLVGPVPNAESLGKMRADLESIGFKPMIRKF